MNITNIEHWKCKDCGKDTFKHSDTDYYMVKHYIWKQFGVGRGMLCIGCLEHRMGRKLTKNDMLDCAVNK